MAALPPEWLIVVSQIGATLAVPLLVIVIVLLIRRRPR